MRSLTAGYSEDPVKRTEYLYAKGIFYRDTGNYAESIKAIEDAITFYGDRGDSLAISLRIELGTNYHHFGELELSEEELVSAIESSRNSNELLYLRAIDRLSSLKIEQGEYSDSESYLIHNLEIKREDFADDPIIVLETLNSLGVLYYKLNDLESADKYISEALGTAESIRSVKPYMLNNLGTIYMKQGNLDEAERYFTESAEGFRELFGTLNPDYSSSLNNLAGVRKERGDLSEALNLYTRVLDTDKVIYGTHHPRYATTLNNIGLLYMQLGHFSLAGRLLDQAKEIRRTTLGEYHPLYIKSANDLGLFYLINGDSIQAMEEFNLAIKAEIKHMNDVFPVLTDLQRKLYFDETRYNIERFCSIAFTENFINSSFAEDALNHFTNTKGMLFYASDKMRQLIQSSGDRHIIQTFDEWRDKKYKLAQAYLLTEDDRNKLGISIEDLEVECTDLEKQLALRFRVFLEQEKNGLS